MNRLRYLCLLLLLAGLTSGEIKNKGWWRNTVFYQIYPRSFMDANNDGTGDLKGITEKLEHFVDLGIGAIWLSPIYTSPMVDFGYDISDFKDIDPIFGTMQDFEQLVAKAKKLGLKVILDLVPNHTSDKHEWFQKSLAGLGKYKDYYVWRDGKSRDNKTPPNNWISVFSGPAWTYHASTKKWYFHQFEYRQPDLNFSNPYVREEMEEVIRFWLRKGVDGFRVDAVPHIYESSSFQDEPRSFDPSADSRDYNYLRHIYTKDDPRTYELVQSWRKLMDDYANANNEDEKVMMTEAYTSLENTTRFYKYGSQVPFNLKFIMEVSNSSNATVFKNTIDAWMSMTPRDSVPNWVMGNHDRSRTASRYPERGDQMTMLAMILPGVAVTYNGEEIGMLDKSDISWKDTQDPQACNAGEEKYKSRSRDPNRTPFQWDSTVNSGFSKANRTWLPVHQNYKVLNLASQKTANLSTYKIYKALVNLRKTSPALQRGTLKTVLTNLGEVLAVGRETASETVVLLINFSNTSTKIVNLRDHFNIGNTTTVLIATMDASMKAGSRVVPSKTILSKKSSLVIRSV